MRCQWLLCMALCAVILAGPPCRAEDPGAGPTVPQRYVGRIVNTAGGPGASSFTFTLQIDAFSTPDEVSRLAALLESDGQDAVIRTLQGMERKGWIKVGNSLGYPAAIIRFFPTEKGHIIRVITDRPIQFVESMNSLRTKKYPFGIIELNIGADGSGEGSMIVAARAKFGKNGNLEIESYGTQPVKILNVTLQ